MNFIEKYNLLINQKLQELIQIYIKERNINQVGNLFVNISDINNINIQYIKEVDIPEKIREDIKNKHKQNNEKPSIIYSFIYDNNDSIILEIDLDSYKI